MQPSWFPNLTNIHFGKTLGRSFISTSSFVVVYLLFSIHVCLSFSNFSDIFDEDHFIHALSNDVEVIKKLPKDFATIERAVKHFRSWSGVDYYRDEIASMWKDHRVRSLIFSCPPTFSQQLQMLIFYFLAQVIRAAKSDSRLANNNLPADIQKLRCRACYEALRFAPQIEAMGKVDQPAWNFLAFSFSSL